ncbi:MAG: biotin--[Lachnospiraceae bacterium]|nr:biotin--[acetyl-CoA-carboxylase] ligase [Lachnospiraceae bacterium]
MKPIFKYFESIDSTNLEAKREAHQGAAGFTVISAGQQTAGRGRSGHGWISPEGVSVATTMLIYPEGISMDHLPRLTIIAGVSVTEAVEELYHLRTRIKWPNDVLINNKKICGILTEMEAENGIAENVVVGIGVNVHHRKEDFAPEIRDMATSIDLELDGQRASRRAVTEAIWRHFLHHYEIFQKNGGSLEGILPSYNARLANKDRRVRVVHQVHDFEGIALEMDKDGKLLIRKDDGSIVAVDSGEVHVRGLYGYV